LKSIAQSKSKFLKSSKNPVVQQILVVHCVVFKERKDVPVLELLISELKIALEELKILLEVAENKTETTVIPPLFEF